MAEKPLDLARIRRALKDLDRLAKEHPELCGSGPAWSPEDVRRITEKPAPKPAKERVKAFRERRAAQGYRGITFYADPQTQSALDALRTANADKTIDQIISALIVRASSNES